MRVECDEADASPYHSLTHHASAIDGPQPGLTSGQALCSKPPGQIHCYRTCGVPLVFVSFFFCMSLPRLHEGPDPPVRVRGEREEVRLSAQLVELALVQVHGLECLCFPTRACVTAHAHKKDLKRPAIQQMPLPF